MVRLEISIADIMGHTGPVINVNSATKLIAFHWCKLCNHHLYHPEVALSPTYDRNVRCLGESNLHLMDMYAKFLYDS